MLFELATVGPGFATDEEIERLGEKLTLAALRADREQIERALAPLPTRGEGGGLVIARSGGGAARRLDALPQGAQRICGASSATWTTSTP